ncbi:MAG: AMP-binding protein [Burkholderiaceae bacterium]|jgi:acyl-CoA synthetase (AMP-forming)/AMP-acid ligase II|nr:AMP-binding protein [Burkholderiaceae bacterium]
MAEWMALSHLALAPVPGRVVALAAVGRPTGDVDHAAFCARVRCWHASFAARAENDWALYEEDAAEFAAIVWGAWHAGKRVFLLGDVLPATLENIATRVQGFVGAQIPANRQPLRANGAPPSNAARLQPLDLDATQAVIFTSGSTGAPEAIIKSLRGLQAEIEAQQAVFGSALDGAVVLGTVSHQHIYGLLHRVLWPLAAGRAIVPRHFFHEEIVAAAQAVQAPVVWVSSPAHLKRIPENLDWAALHGKLRAVFSAGGVLPHEAARHVRQLLGVAPTEVYGSSEAGGVAWRRWESDEPGNEPGDGPVWHALPGVRWRLAEGMLEVESPHTLPITGWWRTPDRAQMDRAGFRLLGRADRIVKIEERRVSLDALERKLASCAWVDEARVLVLNEKRQMLAAVIVPSTQGQRTLRASGRQALVKALDAALADGFDAATRPKRWRFVEALPTNAQGKTALAALQTLFRPVRPQPRWLSRAPDAAELEITLDAQLLVFDGHFPQAPVLPGVAQTDWAIHYAREVFALPVRLLRLEALKFQRIAHPGQTLRLCMQWNGAQATLSFRYASPSGVHASGRAVFSDEG